MMVLSTLAWATPNLRTLDAPRQRTHFLLTFVINLGLVVYADRQNLPSVELSAQEAR